jgi:hypothetical protein
LFPDLECGSLAAAFLYPDAFRTWLFVFLGCAPSLVGARFSLPAQAGASFFKFFTHVYGVEFFVFHDLILKGR